MASADFNSQYLVHPLIMGPCFHKNTNTLLFISNETGQFQILKSDISEDKSPVFHRVYGDDDRCTEPFFLNDGSLIFLKDYKGDEKFQLHMIKSTGEHVKISRDKNAKYIPLNSSSSSFYYCANTEDKSRFDVFKISYPIDENDPFLIMRSYDGIPENIALFEDEKIAIQISRGNTDHEIFAVDGHSLKKNSLTAEFSKSKSCRWIPVCWLDDRKLLVLTDFFEDMIEFAFLSNQGGLQRVNGILREYEISDAVYDPQTSLLYFSCNEEGYSRIYRSYVGIKGFQSMEKIPISEGLVISKGDLRTSTRGMSLSHCGTYLAVCLSGSTFPDNIWIIDTRDYSIFCLPPSNASKGTTLSFAPETLRRFKSFDKESVAYFKYLPLEPPPQDGYPVVFMIHGGPESQIRPNFSPVIQFFVSKGFAVITPNIRGSAGYGRRFLDLDNHWNRLNAIRDIESLYHHLNNDEDIHRYKRAILGASYGGFAVLSTLVEFPDLFRAGVDIVGIADFVTFLERTAGWRRKNREFEYGRLKEDVELLRRISPLNKVDNIKASLFIIHGVNDERVPLAQALMIHETLKKKGVKAELVLFDDEGHGIARTSNKVNAYTRVAEWLKKVME